MADLHGGDSDDRTENGDGSEGEGRSEPAPAKLNLDLLVGTRRDDGYHEIDSLVVFTTIGDRLHVEPADRLSLRVEGPFAGDLAVGPDNLVLRAAEALAAVGGCAPVARLLLDKQLPVAAGLGGGSADAAATLRLLDRFWGLNLGAAALERLAQGLGADVSACVRSRPVRMTGVGERLEPLRRIAEMPLLLAHPGVAMPTGEVFRAMRTPPASRRQEPLRRLGTLGSLTDLLRRSRNDLQPLAWRLQPVILELLAEIAGETGCLLARMSGSGATCFGLFASAEERLAAVGWLRSRHPDWWVVAADLAPPAAL